MTDVDTLAELIRSALTLDEKVRDGNAGPLAALSDLAALARDNAAVREKMMHNAANLDFAIKQREAAEAELAHLKSEHNFESDRGDHLVYAREWDAFNQWQRGDLSFEKRALAAEADRARLHKMWLSQHNRVTELEAENERLREAMRRGAALDIELAGAEIPPETDGGGA